MAKLRLAIHKFSSCSGCQSQLLNLDQALLTLTEKLQILNFVEAGINQPDARADVALVEGSITTAEELQRLLRLRETSGLLISIGACATSGGIQALRNLQNTPQLLKQHYPKALPLTPLQDSTPIAAHVKVDFELWGCPISQQQLLQLFGSLFNGYLPSVEQEKLCMSCKRQLLPCVLVCQQRPCLGPVTRSGCGALCPHYGRGCYACFGPAENPNPQGLANRLAGLGLLPEQIARRFALIHSSDPVYRDQHLLWKQRSAQRE